MKKIIIGLWIIIILAIAGCQAQFQNQPGENFVSSDEVEQIVKATLTAIAAQEQQNTPVATLGPGATPTVNPVWLTDPERAQLDGQVLPENLAGLTYVIDSVWLVDQAGTSKLVMGQPANGVISPDGTGFLFSSNLTAGDDILYYGMASDNVMQFTYTDDLHERNYQWWPARRNVIVYQYIPEDELGPWSGYLAAFEITYSETTVIDDEFGSGSNFALSPDGEKIAYLQNTKPVIYTWGEGSEHIDLASFGLEYESYASPAWSPDGTMLAFHASGGLKDGGTESAVVVLDFASTTSNTLHEYLSFGQRIPPELAFSPDGSWLASVNPGEVGEDGSPVTMWVFSLDGTQTHNFGYASGPTWQPEGSHLLYTAWPPVGNSDKHEIILAQTGSWEMERIPELKGSIILDWINLP